MVATALSLLSPVSVLCAVAMVGVTGHAAVGPRFEVFLRFRIHFGWISFVRVAF